MLIVRRKTRKVDPDDPQRDRVYDWEFRQGARFNRATLSLAECGLVIDLALKCYGCESIDLERGSPHRYSFNESELRSIVMQGRTPRGNGGMNVPTVLHEVAHQITWDVYQESRPRVHDHGAFWLGVYRTLLIAAGVFTAAEFAASIRPWQLRWRNA